MEPYETPPRDVRQLVLVRVAVTLATVLGGASAAQAATFHVDSTADTADPTAGDGVCGGGAGACTLRAAIEETNAVAGMDTVVVPAGTYPVRSRLFITDSLFLQGAGVATTLLDGGGVSGLLWIHIPTGQTNEPIVHISKLTLQNGRAQVGEGPAGMVVAQRCYVTCTECRVRDNDSSVFGGGINNAGTLIMRRSEITGNELPQGGGGVTSTGGGLLNSSSGRLTLDETLVYDNYATRGGGLRNEGRAEIINSTISGNRCGGAGGGIYNSGTGYVLIVSSTITGNRANQGLSLFSEPALGGGIYNVGTTAQIQMGKSILAGNSDNRSRFDADYAPDCYSHETFRFTSFRSNVVGVVNDHCSFRDTIWGDQRFDEVGSAEHPLDPGLLPLAGPGGFLRAHALAVSSPAVDAGRFGSSSTFFDCRAVDQQGHVRPIDGDGDGEAVCDVGATEYGSDARAVTELVLVDTDADADVQPLADGALVYRPGLPPNLSIRAATLPSPVGSVRFTLDGVQHRIENIVPYALQGDVDGDYAPALLTSGSHTLRVEPFELADAQGAAGAPREITFTVVYGFELIDTDTDQPIRGLASGDVLRLSTLPPRFTIRANPQPATVGSVRFTLDGVEHRVENIAPYALQGDVDGDYAPVTLAPGAHVLTAQPFSAADASGTPGALLQLAFEVQP